MQKNKPDVYFIGSDDFINSMMELKEDLKFNIVPLKDYQDKGINENKPLLVELNSLKDTSKIWINLRSVRMINQKAFVSLTMIFLTKIFRSTKNLMLFS